MSLRSCSGWLNVSFPLSTQNREEELKNTKIWKSLVCQVSSTKTRHTMAKILSNEDIWLKTPTQWRQPCLWWRTCWRDVRSPWTFGSSCPSLCSPSSQSGNGPSHGWCSYIWDILTSQPRWFIDACLIHSIAFPTRTGEYLQGSCPQKHIFVVLGLPECRWFQLVAEPAFCIFL